MARMIRIASPKWWPIERKTKRFVAVPRGPHSIDMSLPLTVIVRDVFKLAETGREAEAIIKRGEILVDGKKRKDPNYGVGLLDVIEIPTLKKAWRNIPRNNALEFIEISEAEAKKKICKIVDKRILKGKRTQLNLLDGRNIITKENYPTHDSLLIELPSQNVLQHLELKKGCLVLIFKGKNMGVVDKVKEIEKDMVWLGEDNPIEVPKNYVMVVGKTEPLVKLA